MLPKEPDSVLEYALGDQNEYSPLVTIAEKIRKIPRAVTQHIVASATYAIPNLPAVGWIGVIGYPLYFWVWAFLFPQPYENIWLRMLGCTLFIPFVLIKFWPPKLLKYFPIYWALTFIYGLPFFFTFMLLMNDMSFVWGMSLMAAIMLMVLMVYNWEVAIAMFFVGSLLAWCVYLLIAEGPIEGDLERYSIQLPIYLFSLVAGSFFNYKEDVVTREKLNAYKALGSAIAHELRTPLLGIKGGINGIAKYYPKLLEGYQSALEHELPVQKIKRSHLKNLQDVVERLDIEIDYANTIIDMILISSNPENRGREKMGYYSLNDAVETALHRYPFKSEAESNLVHWERSRDFHFWGSDVLLMHVIFNLLKNALSFIGKAGKGEIYIWTEEHNDSFTLHVKDTGTGISKKIRSRIFDDFYTSLNAGQGTGIGLAFCKSVMYQFDGKIECESEFGLFTEFKLTFPKRGDHG